MILEVGGKGRRRMGNERRFSDWGEGEEMFTYLVMLSIRYYRLKREQSSYWFPDCHGRFNVSEFMI